MGSSGATNTGQASIVKGHEVTTPSTDYRLIPLSRGLFAKVDLADFDYLMQWKWHASWDKCTKTYYATRTVNLSGRYRTVIMHRVILGLEWGDPRQGDHRNGDTLDTSGVIARQPCWGRRR